MAAILIHVLKDLQQNKQIALKIDHIKSGELTVEKSSYPLGWVFNSRPLDCKSGTLTTQQP